MTAPTDDLAARRQRIATLPDADLTPAARRLLASAIGDLRERLGDSVIRATPPLEVVPCGDGHASVALVLTFPIAALNAEAAVQAEIRAGVEAIVAADVAVASAERRILDAAVRRARLMEQRRQAQDADSFWTADRQLADVQHDLDVAAGELVAQEGR